MVEADTTLIALQRVPNSQLAEATRSLGLDREVLDCGDCRIPRNIVVTIQETNGVARAI